MTSAIEFPLRPYTQDWPGLNTTGGLTMRAGGEMSDCTNVQINRGDTLEKRPGFVRALDERFEGVVCGLFIYTDDCGREWLLVADEDSIKIRQPFQLDDLETLDCYPNDGFDDASPDEALWRNFSTYQTVGSELSLVASTQESTVAAGVASAMRWFKDACSNSYEVQVQFDFDPANASRVILIVRGDGDLSSSGLIVCQLRYDPNAVSLKFTISIERRTAALQFVQMASTSFDASEGIVTGFVKLSYDGTSRVASAETTITGGNQEISAPAIDAVTDANLGLVTAIGIGQTGISPVSTSILQVIANSL